MLVEKNFFPGHRPKRSKVWMLAENGLAERWEASKNQTVKKLEKEDVYVLESDSFMFLFFSFV